jgi:hypothetical protein
MRAIVVLDLSAFRFESKARFLHVNRKNRDALEGNM